MLDEFSGVFGSVDFLKAMRDVMNAYIGNSVICNMACGTIWSSLANSEDKKDYRSTKIVEAISRAMTVHMNEPSLCYFACCALTKIFMVDGKSLEIYIYVCVFHLRVCVCMQWWCVYFSDHFCLMCFYT